MFLRTEEISKKILIGKKIEQSFIENKTFELWRSFMPNKSKIKNIKDNYLYSLEVYTDDYFKNFNPANPFFKWAALEVDSDIEQDSEFDKLIVPAGNYAVFLHKGIYQDAPITYNYIFREWLPNSGFYLDNRPHFAQMGEKYKNDSPDSEEEIFIPIF